MKKLSIEVRGKERRWSFVFDGDPRYLEEWRADGLEVSEVMNIIPEWVMDVRLLRPWVFSQDVPFGGIWERFKSRFKQ